MIEWFKRRHAKSLWRGMLKFYMAHGEEIPAHKAVHLVLAMDYMKQISEGRDV